VVPYTYVRGLDDGRPSTRLKGMPHPRIWCRWLNTSDEVRYLIAYTEGRYGQKTLVVEKLDPEVYGGDAYHDLGMCKKHFTNGQSCPLTWETCPWRHWLRDQVEERWVDPVWLAKMREQGLRPMSAPDYPYRRYEGVRRYYADGTYFESSREKFPENVRASDAQGQRDGRGSLGGDDPWRGALL
jgi:hypothetical protein